jgi:DNA-binding NarL/FixJ family response regulator
MSRIYLVDDHAMVRDGMRAVLEAAGHQVVGESDQPVQALADLQQLEPDILLLDIHLRDRSGLELLSDIQRRGLSVRCVMLTMSAQSRHIADALRMGAMGYVLKGAPAREVLSAIETVLEGRRYIGQEVASLAITALSGDGSRDVLSTLSMRERQILTMVVKGQSSTAIGQVLHLSPKTVDTYRSRLMAKLGVSDITALVRWAIREGLIENP